MFVQHQHPQRLNLNQDLAGRRQVRLGCTLRADPDADASLLDRSQSLIIAVTIVNRDACAHPGLIVHGRHARPHRLGRSAGVAATRRAGSSVAKLAWTRRRGADPAPLGACGPGAL